MGQKRAKLIKEKEHLDISDSNALLLHPNQFSITNPASPGGPQNPRKTRNTRHRTDMDEVANGMSADYLSKRKRKAVEEDVGSPVRGGDVTPFERAQAKMTHHQVTAPLYSIEKLFTDKELNMHLNHAVVATTHFFETSKQGQNGRPAAATNGNNTEGDDNSSSTANEAEPEDEEAAGAPEMERTASQNFHATRSTRNQNTSALNLLGELAGKVQGTRSNIPYFVLSNYNPKYGSPQSPKPLANDEIDDDLAKLRSLGDKPKGWFDQKLVDDLCAEPVVTTLQRGSLDPTFYPTMDVHVINPSIRSSVVGAEDVGAAASTMMRSASQAGEQGRKKVRTG